MSNQVDREGERLRMLGGYAILAVGRDGLISFWNPAAERMFGHTVEEALGSTLDLILPTGLAAAHHRGFAKAAGGGPTSLVGTSGRTDE